ncbi:silver efflux pump [Candidatus Scalindua japonica]|uniref:Silver efflux pump n=1 Tax=Candidatus Scalindua japonica TaxID=1284222 RepID=A0A286U1G4_9BACT|nr:ATP synthase subunit I [Candidatus Scalindua japonica]GAX61962.1 silver efflux pump [Candidatus Scalindua japonica]
MDLYNKSQKLLTVKKNFVKQAFYTTLFVSVLMILISFRYKSFDITLSLAIGIVISFCTSLALWQFIKYMFQGLNPETFADIGAQSANKGSTTKSMLFAFMGTGKILVLALVFYLIFEYLPIHLLAFFIGISIVQMVVLSMVVSMVLVNFLNKAKHDGTEYKENDSSEHDVSLDIKSDSVSNIHTHQIVENAL